LAGVGLLLALIGCGPSSAPTKTGTGAGQVGTSFDVTVSRQPGGTVTSSDGRINCGTGAAATLCGPVSYGWSDTATLIATADAGMMFGTWGGDCLGRAEVNGQYTCFLDTTRSGADKYVLAVFGEAGRTDHPNFTSPTAHGPAFFDFVQKKPDSFECTACHGANYGGLGTALSCTECHARAGFPNWLTNCNFCHLAPPPPPPAGMHPRVSTDVTNCWGCHQGTVDADGHLIPGGNHMNGQIDATGGHVEGYVSPAMHGRDYFDFISGQNPDLACTSCHGANYDVRIAAGRSCNTCHASEGGWPSWRTNCSFCHGVKDATTQSAAYDVAAHPTWAAPPDAISQRLGGGPAQDRTGAHVAHLTQGPYATAYACSVCHEVPTALTHITGKNVRASVVLMPPGAAAPGPLGYDAGSGTCATRCHGVAGSPAWSSTGLQCNGCHSVPPATSAHAGLTPADMPVCSGCHPDTVDSSGALKASGGKHVNGTVDRIGGHVAGFAAPSVHGPAYLDQLGGVGGAQDCTTCHGTSLGFCTNCHSKATSGSWQSWQTNCTFCHGGRTPAYTAANLVKAAPPDAITQRLTGGAAPLRAGKHSTHLTTQAEYQPVRCEACHPVPTTVNHVSSGRRATVAMTAAAAFPGLTPAQYARLPATFGTYDPSTSRCSTYCHGSTMTGAESGAGTVTITPRWSTATPNVNCRSCHGSPPPSGKMVVADGQYCDEDCTLHEWHLAYNSANGLDNCGACHSGNLHVNGVVDVGWLPAHNVTGTYDYTTKTCNISCHAGPRTWGP
jgi:hypothetical protein